MNKKLPSPIASPSWTARPRTFALSTVNQSELFYTDLEKPAAHNL
jgi:hypothetical protein